MKQLRQDCRADAAAKVQRYARGGAAKSAVPGPGDMPAVGGAKRKSRLAIEGVKAKPRLDRPAFARGGRTKGGGKTNVTVVVAPQGGQQGPTPGAPAVTPMPPSPPMPPPAPPMGPPMAARPPVVPPPGVAPPTGAPPTGLPVRKHGGRVGSVTDEGIRNGTKVSHLPGKNDLDEIKTKPAALVRKRGGRTPAYPITAGAEGGIGRLQKAAAAKKER